MNTEASRSRLPGHARRTSDAAAASAQAALLGAAIAAGDAELLASAFHDLLHEPYRVEDAPLLEALRADPVPGTAGVTLSGSGPSVVVWAAEAMQARTSPPHSPPAFPTHASSPSRIADQGARQPHEHLRRSRPIPPSAAARSSPTASTARGRARC